MPAGDGSHERRQHTNGGFTSKENAEQALRAFQVSADQGPVVDDGWMLSSFS